MGSFGIFCPSSQSFIEMCNELSFYKKQLNFLLNQLSFIIIPTTYFIFCLRNKEWAGPDFSHINLVIFRFSYQFFLFAATRRICNSSTNNKLYSDVYFSCFI